MKLMLISILVCAGVAVSVSETSDSCMKPPDNGVCITMFMAWYYDTTVEECREFIYGGCGGNDNRFMSEEECYSKCKEKVIQLHPPQNVTVAFTQSSRVYIYWYPPINYKLHNETGNSTGVNSTVNGSNTNSSSGTTVSHDASQTGEKHDPSPDANSNTASMNAPTSTSNAKPADTTGASGDSSNVNGNGTETNKTQSINTTNSDAQTTKSGQDNVPVTAKPTVTGPTGEVDGTAGTNLNISDYIGKDKVPFHLARLTHYVITVRLATGLFLENITVPGDVREKDITGLQPSTEYRITISAVYLTNSTIPAAAIVAKTIKHPLTAMNCHCDEFGASDGAKKCNLSVTTVPWCECKHGHAGLFCEICAHGFYRTARSLPCHTCPCQLSFSTGSCHFVEGYLHCTTCQEEYAGNLCHRCANGYYRDSSTPSKCVKCDICHNIKPGLICDPFTGKCSSCHYNTTGDKCDRCLDGFEGDPFNNIPCTAIVEDKRFKPPPSGIIAAVVVATILLLSGIVGFIVYKRMHNFPKNRPFWTVEFKEDHDDVNFSSIPGEEADRQHDDMTFYESQSTGRSKLPPYSQLKEDI